MNKDYKTFEELKEELGDKFEEFMYKANIELLDKVSQLESTLNEIIDWKDKNGNRYIYQDSLGEDWYFYDLDVFDELGEILNKVGGSNE